MQISALNFRTIPKAIWLCFGFDVLINLHFSSAVLVPFFMQWGHLSFIQMYLLQSWFLFWVFVLEVPTGIIADRFGKKTSLALGAFLGACGLLIYGLFPNFLLFLLAEFLIAVSTTFISGAYEALLYDTLKAKKLEKESKKIFGRSHAFRMTGILLAAPIGGFIASRTSLNIPMLLEAFALLVALFVVFTMKEPAIHDEHSTQTQHSLEIAKNGFQFLRGHNKIKIIVSQMAIISVAGYFIIWLYQPLLSDINIPISYFGLFNVLLVGIQIIIASNFGFFGKLISSLQNYITLNTVLLLLSFGLVIAYPSLISILFFIAIGGGFSLTHDRYILGHINQWIPTEQRATVLSFINMLQKFFIMILNPLIGFAVDRSLQLGLIIIFCFVLFGFISIAIFRFGKRDFEAKLKTKEFSE